MSSESEVDRIRAFVRRYAGKALLSTSAELVDFSDDLYNVTGSTEDPKAVEGHRGVSWKGLLIRFGVPSDADCYVTAPAAPAPSNHPLFAVGGHMTPYSSGEVETGGISYLMPLCKWHNSTKRDGEPFTHVKTRMLALMGYMEGDTALTFALRLPGADVRSLIYIDPHRDTWESKSLSDSQWSHASGVQPLAQSTGRDAQEFAVFERQGDGFRIVDSRVIAP